MYFIIDYLHLSRDTAFRRGRVVAGERAGRAHARRSSRESGNGKAGSREARSVSSLSLSRDEGVSRARIALADGIAVGIMSIRDGRAVVGGERDRSRPRDRESRSFAPNGGGSVGVVVAARSCR